MVCITAQGTDFDMEPFPLPASSVDAVVLSHAHLDHIERHNDVLKTAEFPTIVASPARPGRLWAGGDPTAIWRSDDEGLSWTPVGGLFEQARVLQDSSGRAHQATFR